MDVTNLAGLPARADRYDSLVDATADIDAFCSSSDWILPAVALNPAESSIVLIDDVAASVLTVHQTRDGRRVLTGVDTMWGFAACAVGSNAAVAARLLAAALEQSSAWDIAMLTGFVPDTELDRAVIGELSRTHRLHVGPEMTRRIIDFDGVDAVFARRSATFRRNLRRAERGATAADITFVEHGCEDPGELDAAFDRLMAVEHESWKGQQNSGLVSPDLADFYRRIAARLGPEGRLRLRFAVDDGIDVGYILGGVRGSTYRGFQLSYRQSHRDHSIGHLLQLDQMRALDDEDITTYDLGMDMDYKKSWSDRDLTTRAIIAAPN